MKKDDYVLTVDVGTSKSKCALFAFDGAVICEATRPYSTFHPRPGWAEQRPLDWWNATVECIRDIMAQHASARNRIAVIGVTGQMHGLVCLDANGEAIGPCLTVRDQRSTIEADELIERLGRKEIYNLTGAYLDASAPAAKLLWLKRHRPSIAEQTQTFVSPKDYVRGRLTGQPATDVIDAAGTLLLDIRSRSWSTFLLSASETPMEKLPEVLEPFSMAGRLKSEPANVLGLKAGIPVVAGAGDDIEALGAGLVEPGLTLEHIGTTGAMLTCVDEFYLDPEMKLDLYPWLGSSLWLIGGATNNAGGALAWAREALCPRDLSDPAPPLQIRHSATPHLDEPLFFLPYLSGERCPIWDPHVRGGFIGLSLKHNYDDMVQAVFEGVAFSLRHLLEYIEEVMGHTIDLIRGDASTGDLLWAQMRSDIYGRRMLFSEGRDLTSLGIMMVAGVGIGFFSDICQAAGKTLIEPPTLNPSREKVEIYNRLYAQYRMLASSFQSFSKHLSY